MNAKLLILFVSLSGCAGNEGPETAASCEGLELAAELVTSELERPVDVQSVNGDPNQRIFVVEQPGRIRIIENGSLIPQPFLDIETLVTDGGNEQGLLGLALHPDFLQNGRLFVNFTQDDETVIAEYQTGSPNTNAPPTLVGNLLSFEQPFANHNGGGMTFGPDGYLYVGSGDGGSGGDPQEQGEDPQTLLGSILRIDVSASGTASSPPSNPFVNGGGHPLVWVYGVRNPWRISFDSDADKLYVADVGQSTEEEISLLTTADGGRDLGWDFWEGNHCHEGPCPTQDVKPAVTHTHASGFCSITGGVAYRGMNLAIPQGTYFYADFCNDGLFALCEGVSQEVMSIGDGTSTFGYGPSGEVYLAKLAGSLYKLTPPTN